MHYDDRTTRWFLAQVRPNADRIATRNLERQGFSVFQPLERRTTVQRGRFREAVRPFFPGYLFVSSSAPYPSWSVVNSTYGVTRLVAFGNGPSAVPESVMREIFAACDPEGFVSRPCQLKQGDSVEVVSGPLAGLLGRLHAERPANRVFVLLDVMGLQTSVRLARTDLRPALSA